MFAILHALGMFLAEMFKSRSRLGAENLFLRRKGCPPTPSGCVAPDSAWHQLAIALRLVFDCAACVYRKPYPY
jgi:hypothetical protein